MGGSLSNIFFGVMENDILSGLPLMRNTKRPFFGFFIVDPKSSPVFVLVDSTSLIVIIQGPVDPI